MTYISRYYTAKKLGSFEDLKELFPEPKADDLNFVLFSTSGVHGSYLTIEEALEEKEEGGNKVTVLVCHPRIVHMQYGEIKVTPENVEYLKRLRQSSWDAVATIGRQR